MTTPTTTTMTPLEVADSYDVIAGQWADPEFRYTDGRAAHERALRFVAQPGAALNVGCGSSKILVDLLRQHGFTVLGLDVSAEMVRLARLGCPEATFDQADICTWVPVQDYAFISAWDSIWHVPLAEQKAVLTKLCQALEPGGVFIFTAGGMDEPSEVRNESMGVPMYHATLGLPEMLRTLDEAGCRCRHLEFDQHPEAHVVLIAQRK